MFYSTGGQQVTTTYRTFDNELKKGSLKCPNINNKDPGTVAHTYKPTDLGD